MRHKYPSLVDPQTKKSLTLTDFDDQGFSRDGDVVFFDETYLKYFVKEQLEELVRHSRSSTMLT